MKVLLLALIFTLLPVGALIWLYIQYYGPSKKNSKKPLAPQNGTPANQQKKTGPPEQHWSVNVGAGVLLVFFALWAVSVLSPEFWAKWDTGMMTAAVAGGILGVILRMSGFPKGTSTAAFWIAAAALAVSLWPVAKDSFPSAPKILTAVERRCGQNEFYVAGKVWRDARLVPGCKFDFTPMDGYVRIRINGEKELVLRPGDDRHLGDIRRLEFVQEGEKPVKVSMMYSL